MGSRRWSFPDDRPPEPAPRGPSWLLPVLVSVLFLAALAAYRRLLLG